MTDAQAAAALREASRAQDDAAHSAIIEGVMSIIACKRNDLLSFDDAYRRLHLFQRFNHGIQEIEVQHIQGSVNCQRDFTALFAPRNPALSKHWWRVYTLSLRVIAEYRWHGR